MTFEICPRCEEVASLCQCEPVNTCTRCQTTETHRWMGKRVPPLLCYSCYKNEMAKRKRLKHKARTFQMWGEG